MSLFGLSLAYIRARALNAALNLLLLALGVGTIVLLLLFSAQLGERLTRDARGFDLVIGAKGSPLQLILSSIYHVDFPTGNVPLEEVTRWRQHPLVETVIPIALGDSVAGFRIVGTEHAYAEHYGGELVAGRLWEAPFEATIGAAVAAATGLGVGDTLVGSHGLAPGGPVHADEVYTVVGVLAPAASVLDRLVLTPIDSVWLVHGFEPPHQEAAQPDEKHEEAQRKQAGSAEPLAHRENEPPDAQVEPDEHDHELEAEEGGEPSRTFARPAPHLEVTSLLLRYKSPLAAVELPAWSTKGPPSKPRRPRSRQRGCCP
jgi:putative ABC transport system permease protein